MLGNFVTSIFTGKGRANIEGIIIGTITGGIMVGGLADVIESIGACLFLGFIAGAISGIFGTIVTPRMNANGIVDSQGLLGPVLVVAFLASFVLHPSILSQFFIRKSTLTPRGLGHAETDFRVARYHLAYFGITLGVSLVTGLIVGLITKVKRSENYDFMDAKWFADDYGLYSSEVATQTYLPPSSAGNLNDIPSQTKI